jgi:RNA polymerase sigma factor (sigma-70 family)
MEAPVKSGRTTGRNRNRTQDFAPAPRGSALQDEVVDHWNVATFEESLGRCENRAYRLASYLVADETAAQEILQQTFLSAWKNKRMFATRAQFDTWVYRATIRAALGRQDHGRRRASHHLLSSMAIRRLWGRMRADEDSEWFRRAPHELRSEDLHRHVRSTINFLSAELRAAFILCDLEGMSLVDSAEILDWSVEAARENLQSARLIIRSAIGSFFSMSLRGPVAAPA